MVKWDITSLVCIVGYCLNFSFKVTFAFAVFNLYIYLGECPTIKIAAISMEIKNGKNVLIFLHNFSY